MPWEVTPPGACCVSKGSSCSSKTCLPWKTRSSTRRKTCSQRSLTSTRSTSSALASTPSPSRPTCCGTTPQARPSASLRRTRSGTERLILWAHVEAGKTQQISVARILWEIGRNPNIRICIASNTGGQAQKICMTIAKYIENSPEFRKVFPGVVPDKGRPWTRSELYVKRVTQGKDPTVRCVGVHGNILGARIDLLVLDDILDYENTLTQHQRDDLYAWYLATLETRLTKTGRVVCVGTSWNRDDLMHRLAATELWQTARYSVVDEDTGAPTWPERWPTDRIEDKRKVLGPVEFSRSLLCVARSDEESRFKQAWIDQCLMRGNGLKLADIPPAGFPPGCAAYTGVDLGLRTSAKSDLTCLFTIMVWPNGDRQVLDIRAGRWSGPDIVELIARVHRRFNSIVMVENVAAQDFIIQFSKKQNAVPVKSFTTTGQNIRHPQFGLESMATEISMNKWIIPSTNGRPNHSEVQAWIDEMMFYDPTGHPGDRLMASWFARECSRLSRPKARVGSLDLLTR
jgi:hypothetical protein